MKTWTISVGLFIFLQLFSINFNNLSAQYHPFISENKTWVIKHTFQNREDIRPADTTYFFALFSGDTLINNIRYHKM